MESLWQDLRFGLRTLHRDPGFATVAILTLALGVGVVVAIASIAQAAVFRTLPYEEPEHLLVLRHFNRSGELGPLSIPEFLDLEERQRFFDSVSMGRGAEFNLDTAGGEPERLGGLMVSAEFGRVLGVEPALGRFFAPDDDRIGAERTVVLSHELWQRRFGEDEGILGKTLELDRLTYTVIGVMPPGLERERIAWNQISDLLVPLGLFRRQLPYDDRSVRPSLWAIARLADDVDLETAQDDLSRISSQLAEEHSSSDRGRLEATRIEDLVFAHRRPTFRLLLGAAGLVVLIGCANLVNLLLTRFSSRRGELATRQALGASQGRLLRQLFSEALILGFLGGLVGLLFAQLTLKVLPRFLGNVDELIRAKIGLVWVVGTLGMAMLLSVLVFVLPALRSLERAGQNDAVALRFRGITRAHRLRWGLVAFEITLAFVTLVGAVLMLETMARVRALEPGYTRDGMLSAKVLLPQDSFEQQLPWVSFFDQALDRLRNAPGIEQVAVTSLRPPSKGLTRSIVAAGDRALPAAHAYERVVYQMVSPGYFDTLGIPLLAGRDLVSQDDDRLEAERVVVISESLAKLFWPSESPLDKRLAFEFGGSPADPRPQWRRVVGVVADIRQVDPKEPAQQAVYAPYTQVPSWFQGGSAPSMTFVVQTQGEPYEGVSTLRSVLLEIGPKQPMFEVISLDDAVASFSAESRRVTVLLMSFAFLALVLVLVGVFGVVSYIVTSATREIGIRMALGSSQRSIVVGLVERAGLVLGLGLTLGGALVHFVLEPSIANQLFESQGASLQILVLAALVLGVLTLVATLVPAWKATRVTPASALRHE